MATRCLVLLTAPRARVVRGGRLSDVPASEVVKDDVIDVRPGDQVVVDGDVLTSAALEIDETLLTGESDPVAKLVGGQVLSSSFVVAGSGRYRATRVGRDAYATRVAEEARSFTLFSSRLRTDIDRILRMATWALLPTAAVLLVSQLRAHAGVEVAVAASVGGVVAMVPEGLVLLTSTAFAVAVVRLARRRTLVQELAAVEGLARADVLCLDKTGTLTEGAITFVRIEVLGETDEVEAAIGAVAASDLNPNATLRAIVGWFAPPTGWVVDANVAFSSAREYAAVSFAERDAWILGAPDILLAGVATAGDLPECIAVYVEDGILARLAQPLNRARRLLIAAMAAALVPCGRAALATGVLRPQPSAADRRARRHRRDRDQRAAVGCRPAAARDARPVAGSAARDPLVEERLMGLGDSTSGRLQQLLRPPSARH
jgi:high-affinity K+ transport system ATPase subunit B